MLPLIIIITKTYNLNIKNIQRMTIKIKKKKNVVDLKKKIHYTYKRSIYIYIIVYC